MHILIAVITALGGLAWALLRLQNSGVDLNSFNPFYWARRRGWAKKYGTKPLHTMENPMEAASTLVVAMAQLRGPLTKEGKETVLNQFTSEFNIELEAASDLYTASSHMLTEVANISAEVRHILAPTISDFQERHKNTLYSMLKVVSEIEGSPNEEQAALSSAVKQEFQMSSRATKSWR